MAVVMNMRWQGVTLDQYGRVMEILDLDRNPLAGAMFHVCGHDGDALRVLDLWTSEDEWNRFLEGRLMPAVQEAGIDAGPPDVALYPMHNVYVPGADRLNGLGATTSLPASSGAASA